MQTTPTKTKNDVYQIVTNRIIYLLEQGTIPWRKPWISAGSPQNMVTKRLYSGINAFLLASYGYPVNQFLTYRQIKAQGGWIKPGEKSHFVVFVKKVTVKPKNEDEEPKQISLLRYYTVFNVTQCQGISYQPIVPLLESPTPFPSCEGIIEHMPNRPVIKHEGDMAYYHLQKDYVNVPEKEYFESMEEYYGTLFHELVHCTGHSSRLDRKELGAYNPFDPTDYSKEELVAEMGACFLKSVAGLKDAPLENNAAYISTWLKELRNDRKLLVQAGSLAQKAVDYILGKPVAPIVKEEVT